MLLIFILSACVAAASGSLSICAVCNCPIKSDGWIICNAAQSAVLKPANLYYESGLGAGITISSPFCTKLDAVSARIAIPPGAQRCSASSAPWTTSWASRASTLPMPSDYTSMPPNYNGMPMKHGQQSANEGTLPVGTSSWGSGKLSGNWLSGAERQGVGGAAVQRPTMQRASSAAESGAALSVERTATRSLASGGTTPSPNSAGGRGSMAPTESAASQSTVSSAASATGHRAGGATLALRPAEAHDSKTAQRNEPQSTRATGRTWRLSLPSATGATPMRGDVAPAADGAWIHKSVLSDRVKTHDWKNKGTDPAHMALMSIAIGASCLCAILLILLALVVWQRRTPTISHSRISITPICPSRNTSGAHVNLALEPAASTTASSTAETSFSTSTVFNGPLACQLRRDLLERHEAPSTSTPASSSYQDEGTFVDVSLDDSNAKPIIKGKPANHF